MRRLHLGILASTLAALAAPPARADDKATRDAQARFVEGIARVKAGDFEAARLSFAQAYVVLHKPDILWNLALAEEKSGHVLEALGHFRELGREGAPPDDRAKARKHVDGLMAKTGRIEVAAPLGTKVDVDGAAAGVAPLADPVDVMPGKHRVVAGAKSADADVSAGEVAHVSFLVAETPETGATPPEIAPPRADANPTGHPLAPPSPSTRAMEERPPPSSGVPVRVIAALTLGTAGVAAGGAGVAFGFSSTNNGNTAAQLRGSAPGACTGASPAATCGSLKDAVDAQNRDETLSIAFYVGGGVLAAAALAVWLWPSSSATKVAIFPTLAPAGIGPGIMGQF